MSWSERAKDTQAQGVHKQHMCGGVVYIRIDVTIHICNKQAKSYIATDGPPPLTYMIPLRTLAAACAPRRCSLHHQEVFQIYLLRFYFSFH